MQIAQRKHPGFHQDQIISEFDNPIEPGQSLTYFVIFSPVPTHGSQKI